MWPILKLAFLFFTYSPSCFACNFYERSDLGIYSQSMGISFYNSVTEGDQIHDGPIASLITIKNYCTALIYSKYPAIGDLLLEPFEHGNSVVYFHCLDEKSQFKDLEFYLSELAEDYARPICSLPEPGDCKEAFLESVIDDLRASDNVCITFGAGFSAGYVPTLIEFFDHLGLKKQSSLDAATDGSMQDFIKKLMNEKDDTLNQVREAWLQVWHCQTPTTPAHKALLKITNLLAKKQKNVFIYTDNIDGIHHRVGIKLSEQYIPEKSINLIKYPPEEKLKGSKTTVLVCGQSFDFHAVLSTIYARKSIMHDLTFYSFNIDPGSLIVYDGLDVDKLGDKPINISELPATSLQMKWIKGSIHDSITNLHGLLEKLYTSTK